MMRYFEKALYYIIPSILIMLSMKMILQNLGGNSQLS